MVHDWAASHSMHHTASLSVGTAAAADDAVQVAAVLCLRILRTGLDVRFALSVVKCHTNHSLALPKLQQQQCPKEHSCKHRLAAAWQKSSPARFERCKCSRRAVASWKAG